MSKTVLCGLSTLKCLHAWTAQNSKRMKRKILELKFFNTFCSFHGIRVWMIFIYRSCCSRKAKCVHTSSRGAAHASVLQLRKYADKNLQIKRAHVAENWTRRECEVGNVMLLPPSITFGGISFWLGGCGLIQKPLRRRGRRSDPSCQLYQVLPGT